MPKETPRRALSLPFLCLSVAWGDTSCLSRHGLVALDFDLCLTDLLGGNIGRSPHFAFLFYGDLVL